jgi:hypothetical protein
MPPVYQTIPSLHQWQHDSSVVLAIRKHDVVLNNIDRLIGLFEHQQAGYIGMLTACNLYFAVDYWLKMYPSTPQMEKGRASAMEALYIVVVNFLCPQFNCTINSLPRELELMFGRELTHDGVRVDILDRAAYYMTRAEAAQYKLSFKQGKAYQYPWWEARARQAFVLAESSRSAAPGVHVGDGPEYDTYGFFVMSMSRDIYMAKHQSGSAVGAEDGVYHSAYLGGEAAMAAGSMLIENGVIRVIRPDSGHYKPTDTNTIALLQALQMHGVPLDQIVIKDHTGLNEFDAPLFIADNGNWEQLLRRRGQNVQDVRDGFAARPRPDVATGPVRVHPAPAFRERHFKIT